MTTSIDKINQIDFLVTEDELLDALDSSYKLGSINLTEEEKKLFRLDLDFFYHEKGRWLVHNTFAGGIIFLREPETINRTEILFRSDLNEAIISVEYASEKRNVRNVKYKPNAGQIETTTWGMGGVFPHFNKHQKETKVLLMAIIGKITKHICENYRKDSWFMQFEKPFDIELYLDDRLELKYGVTIE